MVIYIKFLLLSTKTQSSQLNLGRVVRETKHTNITRQYPFEGNVARETKIPKLQLRWSSLT